MTEFVRKNLYNFEIFFALKVLNLDIFWLNFSIYLYNYFCFFINGGKCVGRMAYRPKHSINGDSFYVSPAYQYQTHTLSGENIIHILGCIIDARQTTHGMGIMCVF